MKKLITTAFILFYLITNAQVKTLTPGSIAPAIELQNVNGERVSLDNYSSSKGFIVVFTCNTCPYSKAYEQRIIELNKKYEPLGYPVIAINPNDPQASPGDSFEKMKEQAKFSHYTFPYLFDESQVVTAQYGPKSTPYVFLVNKTKDGNVIEYTGAIDNNTQNTDPGKINYLEDALSAIMNNKKPAITVTKGIGCRISWKKST
jgi:peroxiredoxin